MAIKEVFTTGEVAKICKVSPNFATSWFDSGILKGYKVPTTKFRKIPRTNLIDFFTQYNMPLSLLQDYENPQNKATVILTTGEVGRICNSNISMIARWFDKKILEGYTLPGSDDRRIPRDNLIKFLIENKMPLGVLEDIDKENVILVSDDNKFTNLFETQLKRQINEALSKKLIKASDKAEAIWKLAVATPSFILVDLKMGEDTAREILKASARFNRKFHKLIALKGNQTELGDQSWDLVSNKTDRPQDVIRELLDNFLCPRLMTLVSA